MASFVHIAVFDQLKGTIHVSLQLLLVNIHINGTIQELANLLHINSASVQHKAATSTAAIFISMVTD